MKKITIKGLSLLLFIILTAVSLELKAEPYLAVRTGQTCIACHVNPTGGGKRSDAGAVYGQQVLPSSPSTDVWNGRINPYIALGTNIRASARFLDRKVAGNESSFETERASVYLEITPSTNQLTLYIDELLSPTASNRETYALLWNEKRNLYMKAGRFFLPYGFRLEDDTAFIRNVSGVNFNNSDNGVEGGYESTNWSIQASLTNGTNGGSETNTDKQLSLRAEHIQSRWRAGASINQNQSTVTTESMMWNVFSAINWLGMEWLAEYDSITDTSTGVNDKDRSAAFLEANYLLRKGHNLKLTLEYYDPDRDVSEDIQTRNSIVWEYTPMSLLQLRVGMRIAEGIPQAVDNQNDDLLFVQLHSWF